MPDKNIYYVSGLRHSCFALAENPKQAVCTASKIVELWELPLVCATKWENNVLVPVDGILYRDLTYWNKSHSSN